MRKRGLPDRFCRGETEEEEEEEDTEEKRTRRKRKRRAVNRTSSLSYLRGKCGNPGSQQVGGKNERPHKMKRKRMITPDDDEEEGRNRNGVK